MQSNWPTRPDSFHSTHLTFPQERLLPNPAYLDRLSSRSRSKLSVVICTFFLVRSGFSGKDKQLIMNERGGEEVIPGRYPGE